MMGDFEWTMLWVVLAIGAIPLGFYALKFLFFLIVVLSGGEWRARL